MTTILSVFLMGFFAAGIWIAYKAVRGLAWVVARLFAGAAFLVKRVLRFVRNVLVDTVHSVGAVVTAAAILPLTVVNLAIGRWSSARYYGRAAEDELVSALLGIYRVGVSHPLRLVGLGLMIDGLERRLPELVDRAPRRAKGGKAGTFEGYDVVGTLPEGGSGAQLFLARPKRETLARFRELGMGVPERVVIKSFAIEQGSTLPQIVRESRALEAAKRLGYVLEHHLEDDRFHYVMPYVDGEELGVVIRELHEQAGPEGLGQAETALVLGLARDILNSLQRFHTGGMWHKDIKPSNVIVAGERAHLVDLGLVTPLQSAMTLTTHGTEYYRDPEMVRLALRGVKVHEVDGVRFDVYSAGAVLYSMIENSFPAHGSLSRVTKRCPAALEWVVRRAMADMGTRYGSAHEMLADLAFLAESEDLYAVVPADLPSFDGAPAMPGPELAGFEPPPLHVPPPAPSFAGGSAPEAPARKRGRRRRVLAAAGVIGLGWLSVRAAHEIDHGMEMERRYQELALRDHERFLEQRAFERFSEPDRQTLRLAQEIAQRADEDPAYRDMIDVWDRAIDLDPALPDDEPERTVLAAETATGRVLLLADLPESGELPIIDGLAGMLASRGFEVLGASGEGDLEDDSIRIAAEARNAVGLGNPNDRGAILALQDWLDGSDGLDAVIWLAPGDDGGSHVYRLLVRRDVALAPPRTLDLGERVAASPVF